MGPFCLHWPRVNMGFFFFLIFPMYYFLFAPDFLSHTCCTVLDSCFVPHHPAKIEVLLIFGGGLWNTDAVVEHFSSAVVAKAVQMQHKWIWCIKGGNFIIRAKNIPVCIFTFSSVAFEILQKKNSTGLNYIPIQQNLQLKCWNTDEKKRVEISSIQTILKSVCIKHRDWNPSVCVLL